jgi:hypothetical protein
MPSQDNYEEQILKQIEKRILGWTRKNPPKNLEEISGSGEIMVVLVDVRYEID